MENKFSILITRPLSDKQLALAEDLNLEADIEPAIEIEFRDDWFAVETHFKTIAHPVLAFTSRNGVQAFQRFLSSGKSAIKKCPVYAVGEKTTDYLETIGLEATFPEEQNGAGLARKIAEDFTSNPELENATVLHFCGDKRRDEFRQFLEDSAIKVRDVVVYKTILKSMNLPNRQYDGILFYSPSAVQAYRNSGGFRTPPAAELFAIGNTTAEELSIESGKHVHISPKPDTEIFLQFVARILNENKNDDAAPSQGDFTAM